MESKSFLKSQTVLGIFATILAATVPVAVEAAKEDSSASNVLEAVLPVLIATTVPGVIAIDGRAKAKTKIRIK